VLKFLGIVAVALLSLVDQAYAQQFGTGEVEKIFPSGLGVINFRLKGDTCIPSEYYYTFSLDAPSGKAWYAMLLTAANTGRPVTVRVTTCGAANLQADYIFQQF
jgi:hypothetical protein